MKSSLKYMFVVIAAIVCCSFFQCCSHKIVYTIPADISKESKAMLMTKLDKGSTLFKINCSGCHGVFNKSKDSIPDFTQRQIDVYKEMAMRQDPKSHAVALKLSPEQMDDVFTFLRFRKIKNELSTPDPTKKD